MAEHMSIPYPFQVLAEHGAGEMLPDSGFHLTSKGHAMINTLLNDSPEAQALYDKAIAGGLPPRMARICVLAAAVDYMVREGMLPSK